MADLFRINTNISAMRALFNLQSINDQIVEVQERLSTGKTVNRASDDPAMYFVGKLFETSISALVANQVEIERGVNWLEKQNVRLDHVADLIIEIIDLTNTADSGSVSSAEQQAISRSITLFLDEIENILASGVSADIWTGFSINDLTDVSLSGGVPTMASLNIAQDTVIVTGDSTQFSTTLTNLSSALITILEDEEVIGAWVQRLEFELDDIAATEVADRSSLSTMVDADLAEEQVELTSLQILQQTSMVALIQANSAPASILGLIQP